MKLQFWFEYGSTYSYPAAMRIEDLAAMRGIALDWNVFLLGPLFKAQQGMSDSPFNVVPVKGRYMWRDMERICAKSALPFNRPAIFPQNGLLAARATLAMEPALRPRFSKAVYRANFELNRDISDVATITDILASMEIDAIAVLAATNTPEIKAALKSQTSQAADLGMFGAPSFVTPDGEVFWGNDRLEDALDWCEHGT